MHKCKLCLCCGCSSSYYLKSKCQIFLSKILPHFTLKIHFAAQLTLLFVFTKISFFSLLLQLLLLTFHDYLLFISFIWICIQQLALYVCCKYYAFIIVTCHYRRISNNEMFLSSCGNNKIAYLTNNFWDYYLLLVWQSFHPPKCRHTKAKTSNLHQQIHHHAHFANGAATRKESLLFQKISLSAVSPKNYH